jgi:hypothetical protein
MQASVIRQSVTSKACIPVLKYLLVLLTCTAPAAFADGIQPLLDAAHAGDDDQVEALVREAEDLRLQRDLVWALGASHPDTRAFVERWVEAEPDNAVALTALAWAQYRSGFVARGEAGTDHTWPASMAAARARFDDAFALAERAAAADPAFLPASNAVMVTAMVSGNLGRIPDEARRILDLRPNRHSLVAAARSLAPQWGGSMAAVEELCTTYADKATDAPGFTPEMCMTQAIFDGNFSGRPLDWAKERLSEQIDNPLFDDILIREAASHRLSVADADRLRARLTAEDRLTVGVALSGRPDILALPDMPDLDATAAALERDLAAARLEADRDPGEPATLVKLADLYEVAYHIALQQIDYLQQPPPADIEEKYYKVRDMRLANEADLKARALDLLRSAPLSVKALGFAAVTIDDHDDDPLAALRWQLAVAGNAVVYSRNRYDQLGRYLMLGTNGYFYLLRQIKKGDAPDYDRAQLDEIIVCPHIRAMRLFDQACADVDFELGQCYASAGLSREDEWESSDSVLAEATARGACTADRDGPLDGLEFTDSDLGL